ncbi:LOW QUALITY PROTEIN: membrane component of multidrug resistance system [Geomicrobium sp. JCM 19038]|nr:LOW QUALITY PROTEIN: membrane component of multidrug resistance system [Geomicrobium sp. JCM 19038]
MSDPQKSKWGVLSATLFAGFTVVLNNSLMNVALPYFMGFYALTAVAGQWIITAFALGMALIMPVSTYLAKRFGSKAIFLTGTIIFLFSSLAGAFSWDFASMIAFRLVQGIGGGLIMPIAMIMIFQKFPKGERGFAMGVWGVAVMIAPTIGPTIGGLLLEFFSWHMLFLMNIPTAFISLLLAIKFLQEDAQKERRQFDWLGFLFVTGGILGTLIGIDALQTNAGVYVYLLIFSGIVLLGLFVVHELRTSEPLLDISILKNTVFSASLLILINSVTAMFSVLLLIPILIQEVYGQSALYAGLLLFPQALAWGSSMTIGGRLLDRKGPYPVIMIGVITITVVTFILAFSINTTSVALLITLLVIHGIANGFINTPVTTAGLNALPAEHVSAGSVFNNVARQMMKVISVVLLSILYESRRNSHLVTTSDELQSGLVAIQEVYIIVAICLAISIPIVFYLRKDWQ